MVVHQATSKKSSTRFSSYVLDKFLAPKVSQFRVADIPDMGELSSSWLSKYFLNSTFRGAYQDPHRQYVFNFLRRVEGAHAAHQLAREETHRFLDGSRQSISSYMLAILHWEGYLAQAWMAFALTGTWNGKKPFKQGEGSEIERVNLLHNRSKHANQAIEADQLVPNGTIPVWMEDDGLHDVEVVLTWQETAEILRYLSNIANFLEDPITAREKLTAAKAQA